jgi:hypothetical protein
MVEEVAAEVAREQAVQPTDDPDDYDDDPGARTQRIQALRPEEIAAAFGHDMATAEYHAVAEEPPPRTTLPSPHGAPSPTLRNPHRDTTLDDEDDYAHATLVPAPAAPPPSSRGMLPRRSDPNVRTAARAYAPDPRPAPRAYASDVQVSRRRRGG